MQYYLLVCDSVYLLKMKKIFLFFWVFLFSFEWTSHARINASYLFRECGVYVLQGRLQCEVKYCNLIVFEKTQREVTIPIQNAPPSLWELHNQGVELKGEMIIKGDRSVKKKSKSTSVSNYHLKWMNFVPKKIHLNFEKGGIRVESSKACSESF